MKHFAIDMFIDLSEENTIYDLIHVANFLI